MTEAAEKEAKAAATDALEAGRDRLRETIKWLIASLGAIGASLALGTQLAGLGDLDGVELAIAVVAGLVAFGGIIAALGFAVNALTGSYVTFGRLARESKAQLGNAKKTGLVEFFEEENQQYLGKYETLTSLHDSYLTAFRTQSAEQENLATAVRQLLNAASYEQHRRTFRENLWRILVSVSAAAVAIIVLASVVHPDEDDEAQDVVAAEPSLVELSLNQDARALLSDELGDGCDTNVDLPAFALARDGESVTVLTLPTPTCESVTFVMTPTMGVISPGTHTCTLEAAGATAPEETTETTTTEETTEGNSEEQGFVNCGGIAP